MSRSIIQEILSRNQENRNHLDIIRYFEGKIKSVQDPQSLRGFVKHLQKRDNIKALTAIGFDGSQADQGDQEKFNEESRKKDMKKDLTLTALILSPVSDGLT